MHKIALRRAIGTASVIALLAVGTYLAAPAGAGMLACGDTINTDTTLQHDIVCPAGTTGITIQGDDVTLDLNGHTITGPLRTKTVTEDRPDPTSTPENQQMPNLPVTYQVRFVPQQSVGVLVIGDNNTVRDGTVQKFAAGVMLAGGSGNTVKGMTVQFNIGPPGTDVFGDGILIADADFSLVKGNNVRQNGPFAGITLLGDTVRNRIIGNQVIDNYHSELCPSRTGCGTGVPQYAQTFNESMGVKLEGEGIGAGGGTPTSSDFNTIAENIITGSGNSGILSTSACPDFTEPDFTCEGSSANEHNLIQNNVVNRNGFGYPEGPNARVFGGPDDGGSGILMFAVGNNVPRADRILGNQVNENSRHGISIGFSTFCRNPLGGPPCTGTQEEFAVPSGDHVIIGNTATRNNAAPVGDPCPGTDCSPTFNGHDANQPTAQFPNLPPCDNNTWKDNNFGTITPDPDPDRIPGLPNNPIDPADAIVNHPCVLDNPPEGGGVVTAKAGTSGAAKIPAGLFTRNAAAVQAAVG